VAAPIDKLIPYLQKVEEAEVTLGRSETNQLVVTHGKDTLRIYGMSNESYPEPPAPPRFSLRLMNLPWAVARTAFAISQEESRFTLNGALLEIERGEARMVATDGHRLALAPLRVQGAQEEGGTRTLIPAFALREAAKMDGECYFGTDENHAFFDWGQRRILCRKLTGNFPEWQRVVLKDAPNHAMIPVASTIKTLERVALYADERSRCVRFTVSEGQMQMRAETLEEGTSEGSVATKGGQFTQGLECGLNADYVLDFLRVCDQTVTAFCWQNDDAPEEGRELTPHQKAGGKMMLFATGDNFLYSLMPKRL
jgi:DNA polymerase-3 subunit beta